VIPYTYYLLAIPYMSKGNDAYKKDKKKPKKETNKDIKK
jgi:hypothetical protein